MGLGSVVGTFSWDVRVEVACCGHGHCCLRFLLARLRWGCSQVLLHKLEWPSANARGAKGEQDNLLEAFLCCLYQHHHGIAAMNNKMNNTIVRLTAIFLLSSHRESFSKD